MEIKEIVKLQAACETLNALDHILRISILKILSQKEKASVNELIDLVNESGSKYTQAEISVHLAILRNSNLVVFKPNGKFRDYSININRLQSIERALNIFTAQSRIAERNKIAMA